MTVCASLHATSPSQVEREPYMFYFSGTQTNGDFTLTYVSAITSTVRMTCGKLTLILHLPLRSNTCLLCVTHISSAYISSAKTSHMGYNYLQRGQRQAILLSVWEAESWSYLAICIDRYYITCSYSFITNSSGKPCTPGQTDTYSSTHVSHIFISL